MALVDKTSPPQPAQGSMALPSAYPQIPDEVLNRFPSMKEYQKKLDDHYRKMRSSIYDFQDNMGVSTSKALSSASSGMTSLIRQTLDNMSTQIQTEKNARIAGDGALATQLTTLESTVNGNYTTLNAAISNEATTRTTNDTALATSISTLSSSVTTSLTTLSTQISNETTARTTADTSLASDISALSASVTSSFTTVNAAISAEATARATADTALTTYIDDQIASIVGFDATAIEARITTIETTYATQTYATAKKEEAITASNGYTDTEVLAQSTALATLNGNLLSKYTLKVTAGNVVTGMSITAATGPLNGAGSDVSDITFQASSFKVFNGTTGVAPFQVVGGAVRITGSLILSSSDIGGLGALATKNTADATTDITGLGSLAFASSVAYGSITGTKPPANADVTLSALQGSLSLAGGGLVLASGGASIRGGQTAYDTGLGFWLGDVSGTTKFSIGNSGGHKLTWDGTNLSITGAITLTNTIASTSVSGLGSLATKNTADASTDVTGLGALAFASSVAYGSITGTKPPSNADVTLSAIQGSLSLAGGGLVLASGGASIRGGQTAYDTGTGFWLGDVSGTTKFSIGNSAGNKLTWDGSALAISGTITSTSGTIGGFTLGANALSAGTLGSTSYLSISSLGTATWGSNTNQRVLIGGNLISGSNSSGNNNFWIWNNPSTNSGEIFLGNSAGSWLIDLNGSTGNISASSFSGSGSGLASLNASNISSGTLSTSRLSGVLLAANNLSDVTASTARTNLGLGSLATQSSGSVSISGGTVDGVTSNGIVYSGVTHSGTSRMAFGYDGTNWGIWIDGSLRYIAPCNV